MMVQIVNLTARPVLLSLTSGATLRLAPGETSPELRDVEVQNNSKVDKLRERRVISLRVLEEEEAASEEAEGAEGGDTRARSRKKSRSGQ